MQRDSMSDDIKDPVPNYDETIELKHQAIKEILRWIGEEKTRREKQDGKSVNSTREQQFSNRAMISVFIVGASVSLLAYMRSIISARPNGSPEKVTDSIINCVWFLCAIVSGASVFAATSGQYLLVSIASEAPEEPQDADAPRPSRKRYPKHISAILNNAVFGAVEDMTRILPMIAVVLLTVGILVLSWAEMHIEVSILLTLSFVLLAVMWHLIIYVRLRGDDRYQECVEYFRVDAIKSRLQARKRARQDQNAQVLPK